MSEGTSPVDKHVLSASVEILLSPAKQRLCGLVGIAAVGAGIAAVFLTENEVGSATLMAAGVYFLIAAFQQRFPKLKLGGNEIDPGQDRVAREDAGIAKAVSGDAQDGLNATRERLDILDRKLAALAGDVQEPDPAAAEPVGDTPGPSDPAAPPDRVEEELLREARAYTEVRWTMRSGEERTRRMSSIYRHMVELCRDLKTLDVEGYLARDDAGERLAGVAYLEAHSDSGQRWIPQLIDSAVSEDKPYNEYCALAVLRQLLSGHCQELKPDLRFKLQKRMGALPQGVDRWVQIRSILADCP